MNQTSETTKKGLKRYILFVVPAIMFVVFSSACWICHRALKAEAHARYVGIANIAAEKIAKTVRGVEMNALNEFDEVEKHLDSPETVIAALESKTSLNPEVRGYFAAFEPYYFQQEGRWFEPYIHHVDTNDFVLRMVGSARHDYHKSDWYIRAQKSSDSFWADPYYYYDGTNISGHYTTFVKPIYDKTGRLACVCGADMTFEWLGKELQRIDEESRQNSLLNRYLHDEADYYTVVFNNDGSCIAFPEGKLLKLTEEQVDHHFDQRKSGTFDLNINGVPSTIFYTQLEHVNWSVAVVVAKQGIILPLVASGLIILLIVILGLLALGLVLRKF